MTPPTPLPSPAGGLIFPMMTDMNVRRLFAFCWDKMLCYRLYQQSWVKTHTRIYFSNSLFCSSLSISHRSSQSAQNGPRRSLPPSFAPLQPTTSRESKKRTPRLKLQTTQPQGTPHLSGSRPCPTRRGLMGLPLQLPRAKCTPAQMRRGLERHLSGILFVCYSSLRRLLS